MPQSQQPVTQKPENFRKFMQNKHVQPISFSPSPPIERTVNRSDKRQSTMQSALHISTQVLPGKKIEISSPELPVGDDVEVFIIAPKTSIYHCLSVINSLEDVHSLHKKYDQGQPLLGESRTSKMPSDISAALEALKVIDDYLNPEPGSLGEEMLNDALEGRMRLEATDIQDKMLIQHHAKKYIQQAIATLQRLIPDPLS